MRLYILHVSKCPPHRLWIRVHAELMGHRFHSAYIYIYIIQQPNIVWPWRHSSHIYIYIYISLHRLNQERAERSQSQSQLCGTTPNRLFYARRAQCGMQQRRSYIYDRALVTCGISQFDGVMSSGVIQLATTPSASRGATQMTFIYIYASAVSET